MRSVVLHCCLVGLLAFPFSCFGKVDTNTVNKWNDQALDLAYSDPAEAFKVATASLQEARRLHFSRGEVRALIRLGIIYDVQSKDSEAITMYKQSLALAEQTNDKKGVASNLNNLGLIYYRKNDFNNALKYFNHGYTIFSQLKDDQNLGNISNNIGLIHVELSQVPKGLYWFRKALGHYKAANDDYTINDVYSNMGQAFDRKEKLDSARYYINKSIEGYRKTGNKYGLAISLNNLGLVMYELQGPEAAIPWYEESGALARELGNEYSFVSASYNLSNAYRDSKRLDDQFEMLLQAYPLLGKIDSDELGYKVCYELAMCYFRKGNYPEGKALMKQYETFHRDYYKEVLGKNVLETEQRFAVKEQKQQSAFRFKQQENARFQDNLIWTTSLTVLILLVFLAFFIIRKGNLQKELASQKAIFDATMEERKRISYDLHDHVGSQLSYVVNNLELIRHTEQDNDRINRTFIMSQAAMSSLRDTVWALHTEELTIASLAQRMENVARKTIENTEGIQLEMNVDPELSGILPAQVTMHVMRIFQEAVHNVVKHAKATLLTVTVSESDEQWHVAVADNGIGMDSGNSKPFHYGLQSMQERSAKIGGKLSVNSTLGNGTEILLTWPKK